MIDSSIAAFPGDPFGRRISDMSRVTIAMGSVLLLVALAPRAASAPPEGNDLEAVLKTFTPAKEDPKDSALRKLLKERYNAAVLEVNVRLQRVAGGQETPAEAVSAGRRVVTAGLELYDKPADQLALLEKDVALTKYLEKATKECVEAGIKTFTAADLHEATYARADSEIRLLRFKEKMKGDKK
jgi:hypothetical protein